MTTGSVPFLDLPRQHLLLRDELDAAIGGVLDRADFIKGAAVGDFEGAFGDYQDARHCVGVANGTDALEIAIEALDLRPGSEIIVPANSFIATSEAVSRTGHRVVFANVDATYTLDVADVARRITDQTAAVIAVHLYGQPADLIGLREVCRGRGIRLIEDAAQAHGAELGGRRVGAMGDIGTFSFFPGKNLGAIGDAGAIVTNDGDLADRSRRIANHGRIDKYDHDREGRNSRMDTLQAAVLHVKLGHLDDWLAVRTRTANSYARLLPGAFEVLTGGCGESADSSWDRPCQPRQLRLPAVRGDVRHSYHLFVVRIAGRDRVRELMGQRGVQSGIHYPRILPRLSAYRGHPQHDAPFPSDAWSGELLSLPIGEHMDEEAVEVVIEALAAAAVGAWT